MKALLLLSYGCFDPVNVLWIFLTGRGQRCNCCISWSNSLTFLFFLNIVMYHHNLIKLTHYDETKKRAHDSQKVRAKEELKLSHSTPSQRQASGTNERIKALRQCRHWVWGLTHHHAVKEETIAIDVIAVTTRYVDCRMVSMLYSTFITFDDLF